MMNIDIQQQCFTKPKNSISLMAIFSYIDLADLTSLNNVWKYKGDII